ncbi:hypothetical protein [Devosia ginsengisoli]|uniref:hypothetical protein n=1 Tax=Devosia ginsengisoli TaxID=400770 RepID=UPI0026F02C36|nr:hypothetical protein [Devosia ginsengisoli]MCR6673251.1 hypothetical protein [Devosia ginsengisoli]
MKKSRKDINLLIAGAVQPRLDDGELIGMDDNHVFLMARGQVFRIRVEEIEKITNHPDAVEQALNFMRTLPYGPD